MIVSVAKRPDGRPLHNWGAGPIVAVLIPLADFFLKIGPPRPRLAPLITSAIVFLVLLLIFRSGFQRKPKTLSRLLLVLAGLFCVCAVAYMATDIEYVIDQTTDGRTQRVVVGYALREDLDRQIKSEAEAALVERERERDPLQNASSVNGPPEQDGKNPARDADKIVPFKTEEQIRDERVAQVVGGTGDPAAPYTAGSISVMTYTLLLLWVATFACGAACVGILTVASKLVLRRGALKPRAV